MAVDRDRSQVYAAELAAFDGTDLEEVIGVERVVALISSVVEGDWWPGGFVVPKPARSDAFSSSTRCGLEADSPASITIAGPQSTIATAAHELAHALAGVAHGHDDRFRRAHLDVVQEITNLDRLVGRGSVHVDQLAGAYASAALVIGDRAWPAPPPVGGAIAL